MDIPKLLSFIFGYFFIFRNNRPKTTHLPTPPNSTNILPLRPLIHLPSARRTARHGIRAIPGGSIGRLNRYNPFRPLSKQFHLCIGQYSNDRINFAFPTFQRCQFFRGWVPLTTSLVVPHLFYHFRQIFCRYFFGIFDLRGFCFVCHISNHLNN